MKDENKNKTAVEWRDIKGYEGLYKVSSAGDVKSKNGKILKKVIQSSHGYLTVMLYKDKKCTTHLIHRLVAAAFCTNPYEPSAEINHRDGNKHNNDYRNLEYCRDHSYNVNYSLTQNSPISQYSLTGDFIARYVDMNAILLEYPNYNRCNINMNLNCWTKTAYGYVWKYDKRKYED